MFYLYSWKLVNYMTCMLSSPIICLCVRAPCEGWLVAKVPAACVHAHGVVLCSVFIHAAHGVILCSCVCEHRARNGWETALWRDRVVPPGLCACTQRHLVFCVLCS